MLLRVFACLVSVMVLCGGVGLAAEEKWPSKPIELVIGFPPGGSADLTARTYLPVLARELGVPVVITYKPGAVGAVAAEYVAKAKPDGYTIFESNITMMSRRPHTHHVKYTMDDFTYLLSNLDSCWTILVRKDAPWKDYQAFLEDARRKPGINYGTSGAYNQGHIISEWIAKKEGLKFSFVPFKGFAEVVPALLGGHIDFGVSSGGHVPLIEGGKLRTLLQISGEVADTGKVPYLTDVYPDFPQNLRYLIGTTSGWMGPKGIPAPVVKKLTDAMRKATESEELKQFAKREKYRIVVWDSAKMYEAVKSDSEAFSSFLKSVGFKKE